MPRLKNQVLVHLIPERGLYSYCGKAKAGEWKWDKQYKQWKWPLGFTTNPYWESCPDCYKCFDACISNDDPQWTTIEEYNALMEPIYLSTSTSN